MHKADPDQGGDLERRERELERRPGDAQQQVGNERNDDLNTHGVLADTDKVLDLQDLLDPAEEQLDRPAPLVELRDQLGPRCEIVGEKPQDLACLVRTRTSRTRPLIGLRLLCA